VASLNQANPQVRGTSRHVRVSGGCRRDPGVTST